MPRPSLLPHRLAAGLALLTVLAGCGGQEPANDNELVIALERGWIRLDPRVATDAGSSRVFELAMGGLVTKDPEGNFVPDLATSWEILDDGLTWRFELREGVTFHDGRPFSADDVVWTFGSLLDGSVTSPKRAAIAQVESVEKAGPMTVDFRLSEPNGALIVSLTSFLGIVPEGVDPETSNRLPIGTGPFRVTERGSDRMELAAFDDFHAGRPAIDRVVLRHVPDATVRALELRKGSVDLVINDLAPDVLARFRQDPDFQVVEDPGSVWAYLGLHLDDEILGDVRVRRAMLMAIDRQRIVDTLWRGLGVVTETPLRPGFWATHPGLEPTPYDPAESRRLLDEAGYPDPDGDGAEPRFTVTYKTSTEETALLQAQVVQSMLGEVGIGIDIRSHEFATFYEDVKNGNFRLYSLRWTGIVDPDFLALVLHSERMPPEGSNRVRYRSAEMDRLLELGVIPADPAERLPYYLEAQELFVRDLPYLSLFVRKNFAVMPATLEGFRNFPSGEYHSVKWLRWADQ